MQYKKIGAIYDCLVADFFGLGTMTTGSKGHRKGFFSMAQKAKKGSSGRSSKAKKAGGPASGKAPVRKALNNSGASKSAQPKAEAQVFGVNTKALTGNAMEKMMKQGPVQFDKFAQEAAGFGRESMEAFIKSSTIFTKGCESIFRTGMSLAQDSAEKQAQFMKEAMAVKNMNDFTEVQNKIAQATFEDFMSGATKLSEMSTRLLTEASEPINKQVNKAAKAA